MLTRRLRVGDRVRERDGRHEGSIVMLLGMLQQSSTAVIVRVRWDDTGWRGNYYHDELELVEARREWRPRATLPTRPATWAPSPRRQLEVWLAEREG